jgi:transposase InsO family protein
MIQAFPDGKAPQFLIRDRDRIYGEEFRERVKAIGIDEILTAPRSPWQNPFAERMIGTFVEDNKMQSIFSPAARRKAVGIER